MDIRIAEQDDVNPEFFNDMKRQAPMDGLVKDKQTVQMDIGVGVFDVKEKLGGLLQKQQPKEIGTSKRLDESLPHGMGYHQTST